MANANNKSDYTKPFMDLGRYLPQPLQSDTNVSLFSNLFNRFLTKQETNKIAGYLGHGNSNAIVSRQIKEIDVHRQAFQLQPVLYDKIGSIEHMASWNDLQHELDRLGIDTEAFNAWGAVQQFSWAPPIDLNKLIRYGDYYWVDDAATTTTPQYITVRNRCSTARSRVTFWDGLIVQYGSEFPIEGILEADDVDTLTQYNVSDISVSGGTIKLVGDSTADILYGQFIVLVGTDHNNGIYQTNTIPVYNSIDNITTIEVSGLIADESIGKITQRKFDKIVLGANSTTPDGDYTNAFAPGFIIFLREMANDELNNFFVEVTHVTRDLDEKTTTITIASGVTDDTFIGGEASLNEQYSIYVAEMECQCGDSIGWDNTKWDDNPDIPLWGDDEGLYGSPISDGVSDHVGLLLRITHSGAPTSPGTENQLWYDVESNILYQYSTVIGWKTIWRNFNLILDTTYGFALWDLTTSCDTSPRITAIDQWSNANKWHHKNDITNFASVTRATQPIIEYDWDLELNEWTYVDYRWAYRTESDGSFVETNINPPLIELEPIRWWEPEDAIDSENYTIIIDDRYGDLTELFTNGKQFYFSNVNNVDVHEVDYSIYKIGTAAQPYRTYVTFKSKPSASLSTGDLLNQQANSYEIHPITTGQGDSWNGYGVHWLLLGAKDAVPVSHQVPNINIPIEHGTIGIEAYINPDASPLEVKYEYRTSLYAQTYLLIRDAVDYNYRFILDSIIPTGSPISAISTRPLTRKALYGFDDIRVYTSDMLGEEYIREFGTYDEIGETVFTLIAIDHGADVFIIDNVGIGEFSHGDHIRLTGNTDVGTVEYIIDGTPTHNRIHVSTSIPSGLSATGEIANITTPVTSNGFTNTPTTTVYVRGIQFFTSRGDELTSLTNITIEVGEAAMSEIGNHYATVRMIEDNEQYALAGDTTVSLINYRKSEQVKDATKNQYPLFDIFNVDGTSAYKANSIFGYKTSSEYPINQNTQLRIVFDPTNIIYEFDQFLLDEDNGELFAYRDYANKEADYWYNSETQKLYFWHETEWNERTVMDDQYRKAIVSDVEPDVRERDIDGLYWYNTTTNTLHFRTAGIWSTVTVLDNYVTDINLQTIWKAGLNSERYIPEKVDWIRRSKNEYDSEMVIWVNARIEELILNSSLNTVQATAQATQDWYAEQANHLSPSGVWIGDWEIPDPLYYNNLHENRKYLNTRELLAHTTSIIESQPLIPGYSGTKSAMFNLLELNEVNYGLGGTIKEYNDGFDTLLSSIFVNNVTPRSLIDFAHDQYESGLNSLKEIYREQATTLLTNLEVANILDLSGYIANEVITAYELNDQTALLYGDSTTFTDVSGSSDLGVRNWIATLPYLKIVNPHIPTRTSDTTLEINEVVHHDGHREDYILSSATKDIIAQLVIYSNDPRTLNSKLGRTSALLPPDTVSEFTSNYDAILNREGVYWYYIPSFGETVLYRYVVAESGIVTPSSSYPDGTLWMDLTVGSECLRIKDTDYNSIINWNVVIGNSIGDGRLHNGTDANDVTTASISAWQRIDLDSLLADTVFQLEQRLYENVPTFTSPVYDFMQTKTDNSIKYVEYLEDAFLEHVAQAEIVTPYKNIEYSAIDPFTWNYTRSTIGGGMSIVEADGITNSFVVSGNQVGFFDPCTEYGSCPSIVTFFVKSSGTNDGTWKTLTATSITPTAYYDVGSETTRIYVEGDVLDDTKGTIYSGTLPSMISASQPNNLNDGSESAGDWRALYNAMYNTPYPHLEPWVLQGFVDKPDWWDIEYLNNDKDQWGDRTWKYKHGFEIVGADNNNTDAIDGTHGIFAINGNFHDKFITSTSFTIADSTSNDGIYTVAARDNIIDVNYGAAGSASIVISDVPPDPAAGIYFQGMKFAIVKQSILQPSISEFVATYTIKQVFHVLNEFTIVVEEEITASDLLMGSPIEHYISGALYMPTTNVTELKIADVVNAEVAEGRIIESHGMWENIKIGRIPAGYYYPNGVVGVTGYPIQDRASGLSTPDLPTFNYFSINIGNVSVSADGGTTSYAADMLLPPYWDYINAFSATPSSFDSNIRSLFYDYSTDIIAPHANYVFGDNGRVEWEWRASSQFLYDQLTVAYRIDPTRLVSSTFGFDLTVIGGLQVDRGTRNTPSHSRVRFHGEIVDNVQYKSHGMNQWYVNYNRYSGYDANYSNFREMWTGWTAPLTYQFASFIDTPSLSIDHRYVPITKFDYNIASKRAPGVDDYWYDAFNIGIIAFPYDIARYDNQLDWRFELKTNVPVSRTIKYYDTRNYQFYADPDTDVCSMYTWEILNLDTFDKTFTITGDQKQIFTEARLFDIIGSTGNDATYTVYSAEYDSVTDNTIISVDNTIISAIKDGVLKADYRTLPWETGTGVYVSTGELLPAPLTDLTEIGLTKYLIIRLTDTTFKLALTPSNATNGVAIDLTTKGRKNHFVGELQTAFLAQDGLRDKTVWKFFVVDKTNVLEFQTPQEIQGMQALINIVRGYDIFNKDQGWNVNSDNSLIDPDTKRIISWQTELERFISYAYQQRSIRNTISNRYPVTVDAASNNFTFVDANTSYITGDPVLLVSSNAVYPTPLSRGIRYYVIRDTMSAFRLAATKQYAKDEIAIDITSIESIGELHVVAPNSNRALLREFEMNPFRNGMWFSPERGIVSNIITGPSEDIRTTQLVFDQNGESVGIDQLRVYRQDKETKISVVDAVSDTTTPLINDQYTNLHLGGLHLFIDAYEHVLIFNNYNTAGGLIYDPFIGLNVNKFETLFNKQAEFSHRPNVGGYALETFYNQGANIQENIEMGIENLRNAYDTHNTIESNMMTKFARETLGYDGANDYLLDVNLSQKSQFLFWRGQIQSKGSINAVQSFINSRRFIDAKIDEYWAIKLGEFGSMGEREFPEMYTTTTDARSNELRLEFIDNDEDVNVVENTFTAIKMSNTDRWYNQPDQSKVLRDNGKVMYFDTKIKNRLDIDFSGSPIPTEYVINNGSAYIKHDLDVDIVEVTQNGTSLVNGIHYRIINQNIIEILDSGSPVFGGSPLSSSVTIWGNVYDNDAQNPANIIDRESSVQISPIQFWHPARGIHYSNAIHNIDLQNVVDPATYSSTPQTVEYARTWKDLQVGTTWLNTENLDYVPYYSDAAFPDITERFRNWGQLADWSSIDISEWVKSDVPPTEWDTLAATEAGDLTIVEHLRKAGTARQTLFELDPSSEWIPAVNKFVEVNAATDGIETFLGSEIYDFTLPTTNVLLITAMLTSGAISSGSPEVRNTITIDGYWENEIAVGDSIQVSLGYYGSPPATEIMVVDTVTADVTTNTTALVLTQNLADFGSPVDYGSPVDFGSVSFYPLVNVYVNGHLNTNGAKFAIASHDMRVPTVKQADIVRFVKLAPTDQTIIDTQVTAGNLKQEYEYTQVPYYDALQILHYDYYFWVTNKGTKPTGKNRTMPIAEATVQLVSIPAPHMFFQKIEEPLATPTELFDVSRSEVFTVGSDVPSGSPSINVFYTEMPISEDVPVGVKVNGHILNSNEFDVSYGELLAIPHSTTLVDTVWHGSPLQGDTLVIAGIWDTHLRIGQSVVVDNSIGFNGTYVVAAVTANISNDTTNVTVTPATYFTTMGPADGDVTFDAYDLYYVTILSTIYTGDEVLVYYDGITSTPYTLPYRYTQAIIRGLQGVVTADNRYTIRFTRDFTLRDNLNVENESINPADPSNFGSNELKNFHEEWKIFRKEQKINIDRWQWDRVTEAMVGYKLSDTSVRVPSYERELYDEKYLTDTQYGLDDGQAFVNGKLALATTLAYLVDPTIDFTPIDIDKFFTNHNFDTPDAIVAAMDVIYNTYLYTHVNTIYFAVLMDAFTTKAQYPGLFKTSMLSLHGIRPFHTNGIFDE